MTPGVVKVADTVRRPATAASPFVADLLALYEQRGFAGAPRYLGRREPRERRNARFWAEIRSGQASASASASAIATDQQIAERITWSRREHWHTVVNREAFDAALHDKAR